MSNRCVWPPCRRVFIVDDASAVNMAFAGVEVVDLPMNHRRGESCIVRAQRLTVFHPQPVRIVSAAANSQCLNRSRDFRGLQCESPASRDGENLRRQPPEFEFVWSGIVADATAHRREDIAIFFNNAGNAWRSQRFRIEVSRVGVL